MTVMSQRIPLFPSAACRWTPRRRNCPRSCQDPPRCQRRRSAAMGLLQEALLLASYSSSSDMNSDECSTIGNTSMEESTMEAEEFHFPLGRQQRKGRSSRNSCSDSDRRKRPGTKPAPARESQSAQAAVPNPKAKDGRVLPVVLRERARWTAVNAEMSHQPSTSTTKPSYAAAVKKKAARKPKTSGKPKTLAAATGPKPAPKKPASPKPGNRPRPAVAKNAAQDVPNRRTTKTESDVTSTLALLIPLFQMIN
ncbi:hypothetical protein Trydic_g5350 [Trypoxylus dichotomus]